MKVLGSIKKNRSNTYAESWGFYKDFGMWMMNLCCVFMVVFLLMSFFFFYMEAFSIKKKFWVYFYTGLVVGSVHVQESHFGIRSV